MNLARQPIALFENRYRCKDGTYRWFTWTSTPKTDERLIYAVAHDTTDRKLLEQQTQETLKMRNDFVSFVTHQLRTPLSGIKWMLELAKETDDREEKASYIEDARESADRLIGLVNDLLDASRLESGKLQVTLEPVRLRQLTYDVLADVATLVNERTENIGARRLHTVMEKLLDNVSFDAPDLVDKDLTIDGAYVDRMHAEIARNEDLSRYIL